MEVQKQSHSEDDQQQQQKVNTTIITNPGIADRIEKDVVGFHPYGFSFERCVGTDRSHASAESCGRGILRSRALVPSSALTNNVPTTTADPPPYHLWVDIPIASLIPTVGPLLRTLVRISDGFDPRALKVVASFHWKEEETDACRSSATVAAAKIAHHIHMMIRNSMGAALFLTSLSIVLPEGVAVKDVKEAMGNNENVNYPTIRLVERHAIADTFGGQDCVTNATAPAVSIRGEGRYSPPVRVKDYLDPQQYDGTSARVSVQTRMCTVRLTPILYHLARRLRGHRTSLEEPQEHNNCLSDGRQHPLPLLLVCVDKVANLYRIILLTRDYRAQYRLILVVRNKAIRTKLAAETTKFITGLGKSEDGIEKGNPRVETIDDTCTLLSDTCYGKVVAVDLHPKALTLDADDDGKEDARQNHPTAAFALLGSCGALIWGFEKDGIPAKLDDLSSDYVQVRCRSSLNLVAAMSVVMHAYEPQ